MDIEVNKKDISNKEFVITRHAHSCNNLTENKAMISELTAVKRSYEFDPGLSIYGILTTLIKTSKIKSLNSENKRYDSDVVFVSPLIRTWFTSLLLYLPNIEESETLNLVVSPHLIEKRYELEGTYVGELVGGADETLFDYTYKSLGKAKKSLGKAKDAATKYVGKNINPVNYLSSTKNKDKNIRKSKEFWLGTLLDTENIAPPQSITQQTLHGILEDYLFRLNRKDIQQKMNMLLEYIKKQIIEIPHTIDGGNLPSDVGEQIIKLFNFFDTLGALYETVSKVINKDIATKKMDTKFDIYFHELYKYFSIEASVQRARVRALLINSKEAIIYVESEIDKFLKPKDQGFADLQNKLRNVKDKYIADKRYEVNESKIIKEGKTITGELKYLHAILYDFTQDILNKIKDYFTAEENKYYSLDAKIKYVLFQINKYEKNFKEWNENSVAKSVKIEELDVVNEIREEISKLKTDLEKYNKKLAIAKALDNKKLKDTYDGFKDNPLNRTHPLVEQMIDLWNVIKNSELDKNSSIYKESEKNFQKFQESGNYFGDIKFKKDNRRKVYIESIVQLERRKGEGLPYKEIFIKSKEGSNEMYRNFTDVIKARKRLEELEEKKKEQWWNPWAYMNEIKEQEALLSQRYDDVQPGDRVHIKLPDSKKPIPGIVIAEDGEEIEVEFEEIYTNAFDYIDYLNHTPNDDPYKLIYQALEKMKNKTFKIIIPQTVEKIVSSESITEPYESNDFTLTVSVNEKFHITFPKRRKFTNVEFKEKREWGVKKQEELKEYVNDELTDNQYLYKYYYFVTPKEFPGFRNHPMATVKDVVENYEKLRGINKENVEYYTDYQVGRDGRVRKVRNRDFEEMKMKVGKGIMMQTQYEKEMRDSFESYIPEVIKSIDTSNICEYQNNTESLENCTDLTRICILDESDGKCKSKKGLGKKFIEREINNKKPIEEKKYNKEPPKEGEKGTLAIVANEVESSADIQYAITVQGEVVEEVVPGMATVKYNDNKVETLAKVDEEKDIVVPYETEVGPDGTEVGPDETEGEAGTKYKIPTWLSRQWEKFSLSNASSGFKKERKEAMQKEEANLLEQLRTIKSNIDSSKSPSTEVIQDAVDRTNLLKEKMGLMQIEPSKNLVNVGNYLQSKINPAPGVDGANVEGADVDVVGANANLDVVGANANLDVVAPTTGANDEGADTEGEAAPDAEGEVAPAAKGEAAPVNVTFTPTPPSTTGLDNSANTAKVEPQEEKTKRMEELEKDSKQHLANVEATKKKDAQKKEEELRKRLSDPTPFSFTETHFGHYHQLFTSRDNLLKSQEDTEDMSFVELTIDEQFTQPRDGEKSEEIKTRINNAVITMKQAFDGQKELNDDEKEIKKIENEINKEGENLLNQIKNVNQNNILDDDEDNVLGPLFGNELEKSTDTELEKSTDTELEKSTDTELEKSTDTKQEINNESKQYTILLAPVKNDEIIFSTLTREQVQKKYGEPFAKKWEKRENDKRKLKERKESMENYKRQIEEKQQFQARANELLHEESGNMGAYTGQVGGNQTHPFLDYGNLDRFFSIWIQNSKNQEHIKNLISRDYKNTGLSERELTSKEKENLKQIMENTKNTELKRINELGFLTRRFKKELLNYIQFNSSSPNPDPIVKKIENPTENFKLRISNKIHVVNHGSNMNEYLEKNKDKLTALTEIEKTNATPIGLKKYLEIFAHNLYEILEAAAAAPPPAAAAPTSPPPRPPTSPPPPPTTDSNAVTTVDNTTTAADSNVDSNAAPTAVASNAASNAAPPPPAAANTANSNAVTTAAADSNVDSNAVTTAAAASNAAPPHLPRPPSAYEPTTTKKGSRLHGLGKGVGNAIVETVRNTGRGAVRLGAAIAEAVGSAGGAGNHQQPQLKESITLKLKDAFDMIGQDVPKKLEIHGEQEVTIKILNTTLPFYSDAYKIPGKFLEMPKNKGSPDKFKLKKEDRRRMKTYLESIQLQPTRLKEPNQSTLQILQEAFTINKGYVRDNIQQRGFSAKKIKELMGEFDYTCKIYDEYLKRFNAPYNEIKMLLPKNKEEISSGTDQDEFKKIEDNIWDMDFKLYTKNGDVLFEKLEVFSGSPKPNATVLHSSSESLCSYGRGLGIFHHNKTRKKLPQLFSGKQLRTVIPINDSTTTLAQGGQKKKRTKRKKYKMQKTQRKKSKKNKTKRKMK